MSPAKAVRPDVERPAEAWERVIFFFQAEDGIRDLTVTGVQTCALPILSPAATSCLITSSIVIPKRPAKKSTSDGEKPWMWIGWWRLMYRIRSRYHSNGM